MKKLQHIILLLTLFVIMPVNSHAAGLGELFQRVNPSVVLLRTFENIPSANVPSKKPNRQGLVSVGGIGSGVLISKSGKVLTAAHVVNLSESIHVEFSNGDKTLGKVVASDPATDIALIQLSTVPENVVVAPLGDSDQVNTGDQIIVLGAPYGFDHTLTVGYVSARRISKGLFGNVPSELFQTDAAINQGNSGGPMFNMKGEVIGIVSHIQSKSGGSEGLGFAITMKTAKSLVIDNTSFWNGFQGRMLNKKIARLLNIPDGHGFVVERVASGSPVGLAGLRGGAEPVMFDGKKIILGGDIVVSIDGIEISSQKKFVEIRKHVFEKLASNSSSNVTLLVYRAGKKHQIIVKLSD